MKPIEGFTVKQNPQTHGCTCGRFNTSIFDSLLWNRTFHNKQSASSAYCKEELQYMHPQIACHCTFPVFPLCTLFLPESSAGTASPNLKFLIRQSFQPAPVSATLHGKRLIIYTLVKCLKSRNLFR